MPKPKLTDAEKRKRKRERKLQKEAITAREEVYIAERLKPGVGRGEAAQRAGLKSVPRRAVVERTVRKLVKRQLILANVDAAAVVDEVKRMAMIDIANFYDENGNFLHIHDIDEDSRRALTSMETEELFDWEVKEGTDKKEKVQIGYVKKVKTDKTKALEMLMKHFGQLEGSGKKGGDRLAEVVAAYQHGPVATQS